MPGVSQQQAGALRAQSGDATQDEAGATELQQFRVKGGQITADFLANPGKLRLVEH